MDIFLIKLGDKYTEPEDTEQKEVESDNCVNKLNLLKVWGKVAILNNSVSLVKMGQIIDDSVPCIQMQGQKNESKPMWMKSDLHQRHMLVVFSNGVVNKLNLTTYEVEKELVNKYAVDPRCVDTDLKLTWIVSRTSQRKNGRIYHFLTIFTKGYNRFNRKVKANQDTYYLFNKVRTPSRVKFLKLINDSQQVIVCMQNNSLMMMDLKKSDFDPNTLMMRGRGQITSMEVNNNDSLLFIGTSLKTLEIYSINDMEIELIKTVFVDIHPSAITLSAENNLMVVGSFHDEIHKIYQLKDFDLEADNLVLMSDILKEENQKIEEEENNQSENEEDEFDDPKITQIKTEFKNNQITISNNGGKKDKEDSILEMCKTTNKELLTAQNKEEDRYIEAKLIESTLKVSGLNSKGAELVPIVLKAKEVLNDACKLVTNLSMKCKSIRNAEDADAMDIVNNQKDFLVFLIKGKVTFLNSLLNDCYKGETTVEKNRIKFTGDLDLSIEKFKNQYETLFRDYKDENSSEVYKEFTKILRELSNDLKKMQKERRRQMQRNRAQQRRQPQEQNN